MRLPQPLLSSIYFGFSSVDELTVALGGEIRGRDLDEITRLAMLRLPPVVSVETLAALFGLNPGMVWSFANRPNRHYRVYSVPKGKGVRAIASPRVGLKIIQTWIGYHLSRAVSFLQHVYGFIPGRSHIDAAFAHRGASWGYSVDIADFFATTPRNIVSSGLMMIGYTAASADLISRLSCLNSTLAQGSPISPVLSNLAFADRDEALVSLVGRHDARLTRYADDIVFTGVGVMPDTLPSDVQALFREGPWRLASEKERIEPLKGRVKVHGLIVNGPGVRLTKGYRNKLRTYRHVVERGGAVENAASLAGHLRYADHVGERLAKLQLDPAAFERTDLSRVQSIGRSSPNHELERDEPIRGRGLSLARKIMEKLRQVF